MMSARIERTFDRIRNGPGGAGNTTRSLTQTLEQARRATVNGTRTITPADQIRAFWSKVGRTDGEACWPWTAATNPVTGYGIFHPSRRQSGYPLTVTAHRFAAHLAGLLDITDPNAHVDHECHNDTGCPPGPCGHRKCCNPAHLRVVTNAENVNASHNSNANKTHCPSGHQYTPENIRYQRRATTTIRKCRACEKARDVSRAGKESA